MGKNVFRLASDSWGQNKDETPLLRFINLPHCSGKGQLTLGKKKKIPSLTMVGTVHRDPKGYSRLLELLEREQPTLVTVEVSPYGRNFRSRQSAALRTKLRENLAAIQKEEGRPLRKILSQNAILEIFFLLQEPYEWRAAKAYGDLNGIVPRDIDLSCYSQDKLSHLSELICMENLRTLLHIPFPDLSKQVELQYSRAHFLFSHRPSTRSPVQEVEERETCMAKKIRHFAQRENGRKIVHIGGWEHLIEFSQGKSLFGLLKDLQPRRILLSSVAHS
jgi:hypothetical protein